MTDQQPTQTPGSGHMPTFGERAVGLYEPSGNEAVDDIKEDFADVIDELNDLREENTDPEVDRMLAISMTNAQTACMWAVKAITWRTK
jgi:hypothetical protein